MKAAVENCIFCKIVRGEIPSRKVYEDEDLLAFHDINPVAQVHFMLIPKEHVESLEHVQDRHQMVLGKMMVLAGRLAREQGSPEGFRTIVNTKIGITRKRLSESLAMAIHGGLPVASLNKSSRRSLKRVLRRTATPATKRT